MGRLRRLLGQKIPLEVDYRPLVDLHDDAIWSSKSAREASRRRYVEAYGSVTKRSGSDFETSWGRVGNVWSTLGNVWRRL